MKRTSNSPLPNNTCQVCELPNREAHKPPNQQHCPCCISHWNSMLSPSQVLKPTSLSAIVSNAPFFSLQWIKNPRFLHGLGLSRAPPAACHGVRIFPQSGLLSQSRAERPTASASQDRGVSALAQALSGRASLSSMGFQCCICSAKSPGNQTIAPYPNKPSISVFQRDASWPG